MEGEKHSLIITPIEFLFVTTHTLTHTPTGYYRVNYEPAIWTNISKALNANNQSGIHVLNRAQVRTIIVTCVCARTAAHLYATWPLLITRPHSPSIESAVWCSSVIRPAI